MKRILFVFCLLTLVLFLFSACAKSEVPEGMTPASDPDLDGFTLYVPKGYTIDRSTGVLTAYVSTLDPTSVSAVIVSPTEKTLADYFNANRAELYALADPDTALEFETENEEFKVGKNELPGRVWVYSFTRGGVGYKVMQILVLRGESPADGVAILTYTGKTDSTVTGTVGYADHLKDFELSVANFSFREATGTPEAVEKNTDGAPAGMQLASDAKIASIKQDIADAESKISSVNSQINACLSAIGEKALANIASALQSAANNFQPADEAPSAAEVRKAEEKEEANNPINIIRDALDRLDQAMERTVNDNRENMV